MAEIIGEVIHGGEMAVRERVDNMYPYLSVENRRNQEQSLIAAARRLLPWAPRRLEVVYGQGQDYHYYLIITIAVPDRVREEAINERLSAAETSRCACGCYGSWGHSVSGRSGDVSCVWAGCPACSGRAVGRPILESDLTWHEQHTHRSVAR